MMASTSRFRVVSEDDIESVLQSAIPEKTKQATKYGIKIFKGKWPKISEKKNLSSYQIHSTTDGYVNENKVAKEN